VTELRELTPDELVAYSAIQRLAVAGLAPYPEPPAGVSHRYWAFGAGASQGKAYLACPSKWHFENVQGIRPVTTKPQGFGSAVHAYLEAYLTTGAPPDAEDPAGRVALATVHLLPAPPVPASLVEHRFRLDTLAPPIRVLGAIDLIWPERVRLQDGREAISIWDHKTTSNLKWALLVPEIANDFQALTYVAAVAEILSWHGPIKFALSYATRDKSPKTDLRSYTFEPAEIAAAKVFVADTFARMQATSILPIDRVPFDPGRCGDYGGCPHRFRCAELGRLTAGDFAAFFDPSLAGAFAMSDPLNNILGQTTDPLAALAAVDSADGERSRLIEQIKMLCPTSLVGQNRDVADLRASLRSLQDEIGRLIGEITTLNPALATDEGRAALLASNVVELRAARKELMAPIDPSDMDRPRLTRAICQLYPQARSAHCDAKTVDELRILLSTLRQRLETQKHAINAPENVDPKTPPNVVEKAKASTEGSDPARGLRMPDAYGGELVKRVPKKSGELQRYLVDNGWTSDQIPSGRGSSERLRDLVTSHLLRETEVPPSVPETAPELVAQPDAAPTPPDPASDTDSGGLEDAIRARLGETFRDLPRRDVDRVAVCMREIHGLGGEIRDLADVPSVVERLKALRMRQAAVGGPEPTPTPTPEERARAAAAAPKGAPPELAPKRGTAISVKLSPDGFDLFVDCRPLRTPVADLFDLIRPYAAAAAAAHGVPHYLAADFGKGSKTLAAIVAAQVVKGGLVLPSAVYVGSTSISGPALVEALSPLAHNVIKGDR
jgi:hypothetical protein